MTDLEELHGQISNLLTTLEFTQLWPGFSPLPFALYDEKQCFFEGRYIEKTNEFCANTSIVYHGEQIAIWMVEEETDTSVLTAKIVHEMFHGFQHRMGWDCWPREMEALYRYRYSPENLCLKLRENELLLALMERFDEGKLREVLAHRKRRSQLFPYEFSYECKVEEIEGTANYVEWQVLRQLDPRKALLLEARIRGRLTKPDNLFPIRISCYDTGALILHALRSAGRYPFSPAERPVLGSVLGGIAPSDGCFPGAENRLREAEDAVKAFREETESILRAALDRNEILLQGPLELTGVNIYDARCQRNYLTSRYFLAYREGETEKVLSGNFVIQMRDEKTIETVYRWA